ncbi:MAG: T9SS type A sorting domain-containing protein [Ginsengibacter sp.]
MLQKVKIFFFIFCACLQNLQAQVCSDPLNVIYGVTQTGDIIPINVHDASIGSPLTNSGDPGYPGSTNIANALGLDIQNGTFYYFQNNAAGTQQFISFNTTTNTYTTLANSPITATVVKGCVSADGTGYYCIDGNANFCYYSIVTNTWVKISSNLVDQYGNDLSATFSAIGNGDMVIDGLGNLWIVASSGTQWGLYELNAPLPTTATAIITLTEMVPPTQPTPSGSPFVGIAYNATGQIYLSTVDDLYLLQNDLSITYINTFSTPGVNVDLTSCNYPFNTLSLYWIGFTASLQNNNSVLLKWSVNQQATNIGYNIKRSRDGINWEIIAFEKNNQEESIATYTFTDAGPNQGMNYYRLQALGLDNSSIYSTIKAVNMEVNSNVSIWPVPATRKIYIQIPGTAQSSGNIKIFNYSGQHVSAGLLHAGINTFDIGSLPVGNYIIYIRLANGDIINQKLVKL